MVVKGEFREDLLYRINTIHLEIPALRERPEDIIPLAERFIAHFCKQYNKIPANLENSAKEKLIHYPWYGNIRELEHTIEKAIIIAMVLFSRQSYSNYRIGIIVLKFPHPLSKKWKYK